MRLGEPAEQRRLPRRRRPRRRRRRRERRGRRRRRADADGTRRRAARRTALLQQRPLRCEQLQSQKRPRHVVHVATTEFAVESSPSPGSRITSSSQLPPAKPQLAVAPQQPRPVCLIRRGGLAPRSRIHPTGRGRRSRHRRLLSLIKRCAHTVRAGDAEVGMKSVKIATTERASEGVFRGSGSHNAAPIDHVGARSADDSTCGYARALERRRRRDAPPARQHNEEMYKKVMTTVHKQSDATSR